MGIIWTYSAREELKSIFEYYKDIASIQVAKRIKEKLTKRVEILKNFPLAGQEEDTLKILKQNHRYLVEDNYKIIYRAKKDIVYITDIFDCRQDPLILMEKHGK